MTPIWFVRIPPASGLTEHEADEFQWMRVDQVTGEPAKTRPSLPGWLALNLLSHAYEKEKITLHCSSCSSSVCVPGKPMCDPVSAAVPGQGKGLR